MLTLLRRKLSSSNLTASNKSSSCRGWKSGNLVRLSSELHKIHQKIMFKRMRAEKDRRNGPWPDTLHQCRGPLQLFLGQCRAVKCPGHRHRCICRMWCTFLLYISLLNIVQLIRIDLNMKNKACFVKTEAWPPWLSLWQLCKETTSLMPQQWRSQQCSGKSEQKAQSPAQHPDSSKSHIKYSRLLVTCPIEISPTDSW